MWCSQDLRDGDLAQAWRRGTAAWAQLHDVRALLADLRRDLLRQDQVLQVSMLTSALLKVARLTAITIEQAVSVGTLPAPKLDVRGSPSVAWKPPAIGSVQGDSESAETVGNRLRAMSYRAVGLEVVKRLPVIKSFHKIVTEAIAMGDRLASSQEARATLLAGIGTVDRSIAEIDRQRARIASDLHAVNAERGSIDRRCGMAARQRPARPRTKAVEPVSNVTPVLPRSAAHSPDCFAAADAQAIARAVDEGRSFQICR